jgi:hypothetical protein
MDARRFDRLARAVGAKPTRRGVLGALLGGLGFGRAEAARLRSAGNSCNRNSDCASGRCVQESRTRKICHCVSAADCPGASGLCGVATCQPNGYCAVQTTTCQPLDQCHLAGTCDPATGVCSNPLAPELTPCADGNPACVNGFCSHCATDPCANVTCANYCANCSGDPRYCDSAYCVGVDRTTYCNLCTADEALFCDICFPSGANYCAICASVNLDNYCSGCFGDPSFCTLCANNAVYCDECQNDPNFCASCDPTAPGFCQVCASDPRCAG